MTTVRLVHWQPSEATARIEELRTAGFEVQYEPFSPALLKRLKSEPPDAFVIDLERLPSQGRDLALHLRRGALSRHAPLVFAGGAVSKVGRVRQLLPDAVYTDWDGIGSALREALASPPVDPVIPASIMSAYAAVPLRDKLGIRAGMTVALLDAPEGFEASLAPLPPEARLRRDLERHPDLILWFVRWRSELAPRVESLGERAGTGGLWILWPRKGSALPGDLTQARVRRAAMERGLVDYKVARIDATWTGLRFTRKKSGSARPRNPRAGDPEPPP